MRVAAFAILCCVLQHVTLEIIEDKIHNIFNDRNNFETKNISTSDEFDVDQKTGEVFEKQTVHTEFISNNENCDDIEGDDVKIMTFVIKKDAKGRERIYEEDTIIKKISGSNADDSTGKAQNNDTPEKDTGTTTNKNSDENSTDISPAASDPSNTAESQNSEINWISSKPTIVIINDEKGENKLSSTRSGNAETDSSGQENINKNEAASNTANHNTKANENEWGPASSIFIPQKFVILNDNKVSSGSNSSPSGPASKDSAEKKPTNAQSKPSAGGNTNGNKNKLGPDGIYAPYSSQLPRIIIANKNQLGSESPGASGTTGAGQSGSESGTKGSEGDASPTEDRDTGETGGPNVADYYGNRYFVPDYLYPRKLVALKDDEGSSGSNSSPSDPASKDSKEQKPTDAASTPSAGDNTDGNKNKLGPDDTYAPYGSQLPIILIKNKNQLGPESPGASGTTGAGQSGSGSGTKGSEGDASPTEDRNEGETSGPNVYGQDYYGNQYFVPDYLYPRKLVALKEDEGSSGSNSSPSDPASKDSKEQKPTDAASKPSAGDNTDGNKNKLGPDDTYAPYGSQLPIILIKNKNQLGPESPGASGTTGAGQSGSGSRTKGSEGDASPTEDRDTGETSGPNVADYYGNRYFVPDYLYPRKLVALKEDEGSSGSNSSPSGPASKDSAEKKPTNAQSKPSAGGNTNGNKNKLGPDGIYAPYSSQLPRIIIANKNQLGSESPGASGTTGAGQSGSESGTKGSEGDASPTEDRDTGETSGPNVADYYGNRYFVPDYLYPRKLVALKEDEGSSGSNSSPSDPASKDSKEQKPTDAASKPSAGDNTDGNKNKLGPDDTYAPYGSKLPIIVIKNKNQLRPESPGASGTTGAGQSGSGSGTKGSEGDASPTEDRNEGETSGPNVYGQDYYGNQYFVPDYLYPRKLVALKEDEGSSGSNSSPSDPASKDLKEQKPTDAASKPSAGDNTDGNKNKLGPDDNYAPYGSQLPIILIKNKKQLGPESPGASGTTGAGQSGSGSGTKGSEGDASPTEDRDTGETSGPNVYGQDYYGNQYFVPDYLYPRKLVALKEDEGSAGSNSSPSDPASKDSKEQKPTDAASKPSAGDNTDGNKNKLGPDDTYVPNGSQLPIILIKNKNQLGPESPGASGTTGAGQSGSGSGTKGSEGDASPTEDRDTGETSGPNVADYYGNRYFVPDYLYPRKLVALKEDEGSSGSNSSPSGPASKDSAEKKPTNAQSKPSAGGNTNGNKNKLGPDGIYAPYSSQLPRIIIANKNQLGSESPGASGTTGAGQSGSGSGTKGSEGDASPTEDRDTGETSGPNVADYYGNRYFVPDYLYPRKLVALKEDEGSSGLNSSPSDPASKDSKEQKPTDAASKPSAGDNTDGNKNKLGPDDTYAPYGSQLPIILIKNKNQLRPESPGASGTTGAGQSGSGSGTKGSEGDASPTEDRNEGETSGPNVYGQDYYGNQYFVPDYLYPRKLVALKEDEGSSGSNSSPSGPASKDSAEKKPTNAQSKPSAGGNTDGNKNKLGPDDTYAPYGSQLPIILIKNKNQLGPESPGASGTTGAGQSGSGSGTKGSEGDASPTEDRDTGETSGPNVADYYGNRYFVPDYLYPRKLVALKEDEGSSGSNSSPSDPASKDSKEQKPTDAASKPSAGDNTDGNKNKLGPDDTYAPYGSQLPIILIKNKNQLRPESPGASGTTGAGQSGSGSGTKGSEGDASPTEDRNEGETSGPNVYGQDYYGNQYFVPDYLYPRKLVALKEDEGSSGSNSSPSDPASKDSKEQKPTDAASKPSAGDNTDGNKNKLGPDDTYAPYGSQLPIILIKNKKQLGPESPGASGTTGAGQSGSGSGTKGSEGDASSTEDRDTGETSGPNVADYYGNRYFVPDYLYPRKLVALKEDEGSSGSNSSPSDPASKDSKEQKPTDAASKPSAGDNTDGNKNKLGPDDTYAPYGSQLPIILIKNKNQLRPESPGASGTTGAGQSGSGSGTKGSEGDASPTEDRGTGETSGPNVADYYGNRYFVPDYLYPRKLVALKEDEGSSGSNSSPSDPASKDSKEQKPTDAASKPSAGDNTDGNKNKLGPDDTYAPYGSQLPIILIKNKNQLGPESPGASGTTGAGQSGSGSGTKGSEGDASPTEDRDTGETSGPNVADYYGNRYFVPDYLYPRKLVALKEDEGSSGSNSSPSDPASKDSKEQKPTDAASKPSAGDNTDGNKNKLGPDDTYAPYGSQLPIILIKNKNQLRPESPGASGTTGAGQSGSGSGTKGSEGDASPTEDRNEGETSGPNVYGQDYYGNQYFVPDYLYPRKLVALKEDEGSSGSNSSPSDPASKDSKEQKPTDAASKPSAGDNTDGNKNKLGPDGTYAPYASQFPRIVITNKNQLGSESPRASGTTGDGKSGSGSGTKGSEGDASPTEDRNEGETSGPNVYGQDYYGNQYFVPDYLYPRKLVALKEDEGSSGSNPSPSDPASKDSKEQKPTDAASKPSAGDNTDGIKNKLGPDDTYAPYGSQLPIILIKNKNQLGPESPGASGTTGAGQSGSGSGTKGSEGDASSTEDRDTGETSGPNVADYYGNRYFVPDYLYPRKLVALKEDEGSSGSNPSPSDPASKDSAEKKPTDAASKPAVGGNTDGNKNTLGSAGDYRPYGSQLPSIVIENKNQLGSDSPGASGSTGAGQSGSGSGKKGSNKSASIDHISSQRIKRMRQACRLRRRQYSIRLGRKGQPCESC